MRRVVLSIGLAFGMVATFAAAAQAAEPVLAAEAVSVAEDATSGLARVTLRLDRKPTRRIPVNFETVNGTARAGKDYTAKSGKVVFPVGVRTKTIGIALLDDRLDEGKERFSLKLSSTRARLPAARVTVTITDDDPLPKLSAGSVTVTEGARGTNVNAPVPLNLSRVSGRNVTVTWAVVNGTAEAGADATGTGRVTIPAGKKTIALPAKVVGDAVAEGNERAVVKLSKVVNAVLSGNGGVNITDDDADTATDVQVKLDSSRAVSRAFTAVADDGFSLVGGTMTTTAADGTQFRLTIPDGALLKETTITMTPWSQLEGIAHSGGQMRGVDLKPNGTQLLDSATLQIIPPDTDGDGVTEAVPAETFSYVAGGRGAHRYPLTLDHNTLTFKLNHFSGYGGVIGETTIIFEPLPPAELSQALASEIQRIVGEERANALKGEPGDPEWANKVVSLLDAFYTELVHPKLNGIRTDCAQAKANNGFVLGWARNASLFAETHFAAKTQTVLSAVADGAENCLEEAMRPCVDHENAAQMREIVTAARTVSLLGGTMPEPSPFDESRKCKDLLIGTIVIDYREVSGNADFHHDKQFTATLNPRLVQSPGTGGWMDDGRGGWSITGQYVFDDQRENSCGDWTDVYSGSGVFNTTYPMQLSSEDVGQGNLLLDPYVPGYPYAMDTELDHLQFVAATHETRQVPVNSACETQEGNGHTPIYVPPCPGDSGGVDVTPFNDSTGQGVQIDCTRTVHKTGTDGWTSTETMTVKGKLTLTKG